MLVAQAFGDTDLPHGPENVTVETMTEIVLEGHSSNSKKSQRTITPCMCGTGGPVAAALPGMTQTALLMKKMLILQGIYMHDPKGAFKSLVS